jgi:TRAP-type mannitol/chloroaromatic compound transport system permease small subunit
MSLVVVYDAIIARYVIGTPTVWGWDVTYMLGGSCFMLGGAYILRTGGHIRIDFLHERFSPRTKAIVELLFYICIFFPLIVVIVKYSLGWTLDSWAVRERTTAPSFWLGPLYPFKTVLPVAAFLLGVQGVVEFIRNLVIAVKGPGE